MNIPLNFGPKFTSGTLYAYVMTSFGIVSDTICMTINSLVGIAEGISTKLNFQMDNQQEQLSILLPENFESVNILVYVAIGKTIISIIAPSSGNKINRDIFDVHNLENGMYSITVANKKTKLHGKSILSR